MMKKQLMILFMTASLAAASMTGCASSNGNETTAQESSAASAESDSEISEETEAPSAEAPDSSQEENAPALQADETLTSVLNDIKEAYGDNYVPNSELDAQMLEDIVGLTPDLYDSAVAEMPMINTFVETFIGVKASEGNGDQAEQILNEYRDRLVSDTMQYPMNIAKIQASEVVRHGDYIFFVMLGAPDDAAMEQGDEAALQSAIENNQIAVSAIDKNFQ